MKKIVFIILSFFENDNEPNIGIVNIDEEMVEAIYIPAHYNGPIIAIPADARVF